MESLVRILNQSPLTTRQYQDRKTGEPMQATTIYIDRINLA